MELGQPQRRSKIRLSYLQKKLILKKINKTISRLQRFDLYKVFVWDIKIIIVRYKVNMIKEYDKISSSHLNERLNLNAIVSILSKIADKIIIKINKFK